MTAADPIAALVAVLAADAGVAALAGSWVYGLELPKDRAAAMPRQAVVISPDGGVSLAAGSYLQHDTLRVEIVCYGATPYQAQQLRAATAAALKPLRREVAASTLLHWVEPAGGYRDGRAPDTDWPLAAQTWQAFYAENEAA